MMQRQALDLGVVGLVDMEWGRPWESWPAQSPRMRIRTAVYPAELAHAPGPTGTVLDPTGLVTMGPLKVIVDGALGSHSAYTREAYSDGHGYAGRGVLSYGADELLDALTRASAQGLTAAVHAIGDAAAQIALGAISDRSASSAARLEHAQMLTDDDVAAMAALGVTASVQPAHLLDDRDATESRVARPGHTGVPSAGSAQTPGVPLALGSDAPVAPLDPWLAMAAAVHRSADDRPGWHPGQQLQPREALAASTDGVRRLEAGGPADLVLLEESPFGDVPLGADGLMVDAAAREAALRLRETRVLTTIVAARASS